MRDAPEIPFIPEPEYFGATRGVVEYNNEALELEKQIEGKNEKQLRLNVRDAGLDKNVKKVKQAERELNHFMRTTEDISLAQELVDLEFDKVNEEIMAPRQERYREIIDQTEEEPFHKVLEEFKDRLAPFMISAEATTI